MCGEMGEGGAHVGEKLYVWRGEGKEDDFVWAVEVSLMLSPSTLMPPHLCSLSLSLSHVSPPPPLFGRLARLHQLGPAGYRGEKTGALPAHLPPSRLRTCT